MLLKTRPQHPIASSSITPEQIYWQRREFLAAASGALLTSMGLGLDSAWAASSKAYPELPQVKPNPSFQDAELKKKLTRFEDISSYNNFYEFGFDKDEPKKNSQNLKTKPWTVKVHGLVDKPGSYLLEDFIKPYALEDRIYRFRCVEAWSMVVPWVGFPLRLLLDQAKPTSKAKFVTFKTLYDPTQMPMQMSRSLDWPYTEALRLDEAMHDLSFLAVGVYGRILPNQNGAPLRLVVPWKYGYKSIKSIVSIELTAERPKTTWELKAPDEYPFYSNVLPEVSHPRWSQKTERILGSGFFSKRQETLPYNGYEAEVASLYKEFDRRKLY